MSETSFATEVFSLSEIVDDYQGRSSIYLEKTLLDAFPKFDLKMIRGLPRLYRRDKPSESHIMKNFAHLPSLKRLAASRFVMGLYGEVAGKVAVVDSDGTAEAILKERLGKVKFVKDVKAADLVFQMSEIGKYGCLETFHPRSGHYSMGLHFLEKGVLIGKKGAVKVENEAVKKWLKMDQPFYLADLTTPIGGAIYLHALLKSLERDPRDVHLLVPNLDWFIEFVQNREGQPILVGNLGVQQIEVRFQEKSYVHGIQSEGKKVKIFCPGTLSHSDVQVLMSLSQDFVAVQGDRGFSDAVSAEKAFFFDGTKLSRSFMKDLVALAENKIRGNAVTVMRGMMNALVAQLPEEEGEWVDETYFQEKEDWITIANAIGTALQQPDTIQGFKRFNAMIAKEYSANDFLCQYINRALSHKKHPKKLQFETTEMALFLSNQQSFAKLFEKLQLLRL
jgi:hypothetical protein